MSVSPGPEIRCRCSQIPVVHCLRRLRRILVFGPQRLRPWEKSNRAAVRSDARRHNNAGAKKNNKIGTRRHVSERERGRANAMPTKLSWGGSFGRAALDLERIVRILWRGPANFCQTLPTRNGA